MLRRIIVVVILLFSDVSFAQKNNTLAYSFFGNGDKNSSSLVEQESMGGVGVSLNGFSHLNISNPAANSLLKLALGIGIGKEVVTIDEVRNGDDFIAIGNFGISFGIGLPVSKQLSNLNIRFDFEKRKNISKGLV